MVKKKLQTQLFKLYQVYLPAKNLKCLMLSTSFVFKYKVAGFSVIVIKHFHQKVMTSF